MTVFTRDQKGELVEWWLGEAWTEAVLNGLEFLPSPHGGVEKIEKICLP
jgi:hypothetical protein